MCVLLLVQCIPTHWCGFAKEVMDSLHIEESDSTTFQDNHNQTVMVSGGSIGGGGGRGGKT